MSLSKKQTQKCLVDATSVGATVVSGISIVPAVPATVISLGAGIAPITLAGAAATIAVAPLAVVAVVAFGLKCLIEDS